MWVSCGEQYFPILQMKPSQEDWQKLVFKRKNCSVLEKLSSLWINNYLTAGYRRRRKRGLHTKAPVKIAAGTFVCMKEDMTAVSHKNMHGMEPPLNWATTCMCVKFMVI